MDKWDGFRLMIMITEQPYKNKINDSGRICRASDGQGSYARKEVSKSGLGCGWSLQMSNAARRKGGGGEVKRPGE